MNNLIFYNELDSKSKQIFDNNVTITTLNKGAILVQETSTCSNIPFVIKGGLRLFRTSETGREMTIYNINKGDLCVLAAICVMGELEYDFSVMAKEDSFLAVLPASSFMELMDNSMVFKQFILKSLSEKLVTSLNTIEMINFSSITDRILKYLEENVDENNELIITHEYLAVELGTTREVVSRELRKLVKDNKIIQNRGKIKFLSK